MCSFCARSQWVFVLNGRHGACESCYAFIENIGDNRKTIFRAAWYLLTYRDAVPVKRRWVKLPWKDRRARYLMDTYKVSVAEWEWVLHRQGGVCDICETHPAQPYLFTDHDHATEQLRGLLCNTCNLGLGCVDDNPETVIRIYRAAPFWTFGYGGHDADWSPLVQRYPFGWESVNPKRGTP